MLKKIKMINCFFLFLLFISCEMRSDGNITFESFRLVFYTVLTLCGVVKASYTLLDNYEFLPDIVSLRKNQKDRFREQNKILKVKLDQQSIELIAGKETTNQQLFAEKIAKLNMSPYEYFLFQESLTVLKPDFD